MPDTPQTVGDLVRAYLAEQATVLIDAESALRSREPAIHATRVAARRLRSTLRTYEDVVDVARAGTLEDELVWFAGLLGEVRDREVLEARLLADLAELPTELVVGPVAGQIETELTTQRKVAWDAIIAVLDDDRYRRLLGELRTWRSDAPLTSEAAAPAASVKRYVKRAGKKLDKRLDRAIEAHLTGDAEADHLLHQARKAGKRARYAAELLEPVLGKDSSAVIAASYTDLQDILGDHQDIQVSTEVLRRLATATASRPDQNGFTFGVLYQREVDKAAGLEDAAGRWLIGM